MTLTASEILLYYSYKHNGDKDKIAKDITDKAPVDTTTLPFNTIKSAIYGSYTTLLDKEYPIALRNAVLYPFCLFYKGDLNIIDNNIAIGILAEKLSVSQAINSYSKYALVQVIKKYAPQHNIYLQISDEYHKLAVKTFRKYAGEGKKLIEFTNKSLKDYELTTPSTEQSDLVMSVRWNTDNSFYTELQAFAVVCEKIIVVESPNNNTFVSPFLGVAIANLKTVEVVPYPFFDTSHRNNTFIAQGSSIYQQNEEEK